MTPIDELALVKEQVRRIEADLSQAREQLERIERDLSVRVVTDASVAAPSVTEVVSLTPPLPPPLPVFAALPVASEAPPASPPTVPSEPPTPWVPPPEPKIEGPSPLRVWLTQLQLWPPDGEGNAEVRLGAWWATRMGALLAVIGVVLFGVYVSVNTPPWVKFVELVTVSTGVTAAGLWLERRIPRFGAVVFGAGLALLYFCAFAAYALPPVKVLGSVVAASGWQLVAVAVLVGAAVVRQSPTIATMAVGLGYVTSFFSRSGGLHDFALCTAGLLAAASIVLYRRLRWEAPSVLALPGTYAVFALVLHGTWWPSGAAPALWAWGLLAGFAVMFFARDWRRSEDSTEVSWGERWFQGVNACLALVVGVALALSLFRAHLAWFYFGAAALLVALAFVRRRQIEDDVVSGVLLAKAAGALTLGVIEVADGRTTAIALLVQGWVLFITAKSLRARVLAVATAVVAGVALVFFVGESMPVTHVTSLTAVLGLLFVVGLSLLVAETCRQWLSSGSRWAGDGIGVMVTCLAAWVAVQSWQPVEGIPVWLVVMAVGLAIAAWARHSVSPAIAGALLLLGANLVLCSSALAPTFNPWLVPNAVVVLSVTVLAGYWLGDKGVLSWGKARRGALKATATASWALALVGLVLVIFHESAGMAAMWTTAGVAVGVAALSPVLVTRHLPWLAAWTVSVGLLCWQGHGAVEATHVAQIGLLASVWLLPILLQSIPRLREVYVLEPQPRLLEGLLVGMATVITVRVLPWTVAPDYRVPLFAAAALGAFGLCRRPGVSSALLASWIFWLMAVILGVGAVGADGWSAARIGCVAATLLVWLPVIGLVRWGIPGDAAWWRGHGASLQVSLAVIVTIALSAVAWSSAAEVLALGVGSLVALMVLRVTHLAAARIGALLLLAWSWGQALLLAMPGGPDGSGFEATAILLVSAGMMAFPWQVDGGAHVVSREQRRQFSWVTGTSALLLIFVWAALQQGSLAPYTTVGWGAASILLFAVGLFVRLRPYRLLGLIGLLLCIPRVFFIDLQSAFHRIIAFVVLGVVLLWVGFSYHRFRHLVVDTKEKDDA